MSHDINETQTRSKVADEDNVSNAQIKLHNFDNKENLSRIPYLCLVEICKYLTRMDIYQLSNANRQMRIVATERSLEKIKWEGGELLIAPTVGGYAFELSIRCISNGRMKRIAYQYEIVKGEDDMTFERKVINGSLQFSSNLPEWPIPEDFFTALADILMHNEARYVEIRQLEFDGLLFTKLESALREQRVHLLECVDMECKEITNDTRKRFALLLKNRLRDVDLRKSVKVNSIINEQFLYDIGKTNLSEFYCNWIPSAIHTHLFNPSKSIISRIVSLDSLYATAMTLNVELLMLLIMEYMEITPRAKRSKIGRWCLSVNQPLNSQDIALHIKSDYTYQAEGATTHVIVGRNKITKFQQNDYKVDGGRAIFHLVHVEFNNEMQDEFQNLEESS